MNNKRLLCRNLMWFIFIMICTSSCDSPGVQRVKGKRKLRIEKEKQQKVDCYNYFKNNPYIIDFTLINCIKKFDGKGKAIFSIKDVVIHRDEYFIPRDSINFVLEKLNYQFRIIDSEAIYFRTNNILLDLYRHNLVKSREKSNANVTNLKYRYDVKNKNEYCEGHKLRSNLDCRKWNKFELSKIKKAEKRRKKLD